MKKNFSLLITSSVLCSVGLSCSVSAMTNEDQGDSSKSPIVVQSSAPAGSGARTHTPASSSTPNPSGQTSKEKSDVNEGYLIIHGM